VLELRPQFPLAGLLRVAGLARSTFYYQQKALAGEDKHHELRAAIRATFESHKGRYGYRRVTQALRLGGRRVNHKTVQRLMVEQHLRSRVRVKRFRAFSGRGSVLAPNILERDFNADRANQKWVTDMTEFKVGGKKLYLSPIMDLYNGEIISYEKSQSPTTGMFRDMLNTAFSRLAPDQYPVLHSDQGWQYRMPSYRKQLDRHAVVQSMSRKGNCLDNAAIESFFGTLKSELFYLHKFASVEELEHGIDAYIRYYNEERIKLKLGMSPVAFRKQQETAELNLTT
jgi:putative transposase